ncbi:MAG TPA: outer membrane beta-barrel protein [Asticcacaulis sp.]|nr:outer membrane beta-barrel protein [Asticcacaulis sp.]
MTKTQLLSMTAGLAIVMGLAAAQSAGAQATVDNNFGRDRSVAVNDRAKTDYQPLGIRLGAFMANPQIGVSLNSNDNVFYDDAKKKSDVVLEVTPSVEVASDWSRNALAFGISSAIDQYGSATTENATSWNAHASGRYDISSHVNVFGNLSHDDGVLSRSDPLASTNSAKPTKRQFDNITTGFTLVGNRLRLIAQTSQREETYHDVLDNVGGTIPEHLRNLTTYTGSVRVDYALSPNVSVYVNGELNRRKYDDFNQARFNAKGSILSVGTSFDLDKLARGEIEVGSVNQTQKYQPALGKQTSTYVNGKVEWYPTEITTVTFNAGTNFTDAGLSGAPTALVTRAGVNVDHELLRNLILSAGLNGEKYAFKGLDRTDTRQRLSFAANYFLSRRVVLNASFNHDQLKSRGAAAYNKPFTDNNIQVGIVLKY